MLDHERLAAWQLDVLGLGEDLDVALEVGMADGGEAVAGDELAPLPLGVGVGGLAARHTTTPSP